MKYKPKLSLIINGQVLGFKFLEALDQVAQTMSQRKASQILGISHAVLNRRIKDAEEKLSMKLVDTTGSGSELTKNGREILQKYRNLMKRLEKHTKPVISGGYISTGLIEVLAAEYGLDVLIYKSDDESALYLADRDMVDILTLDDPAKAFMRDLDFIPIARDHLVLVSPAGVTVEHLDELEGKKFVEIVGSSQRLAWNTLDNKGVDYNLVKHVKSPYEALKLVQSNKDLYTFLNNSFIPGCDMLKDDTQHIITLVLLKQDNERLKRFLEFILGRGRKIIKESGFETI